jgi:hypothetical protein
VSAEVGSRPGGMKGGHWLAVVDLNGNVRIAACSIVSADTATLRGRDIELSGKVRMQLTNGVDRLKVQ